MNFVDRLVRKVETTGRGTHLEMAQYWGVLAERRRRPSLHRKRWSRLDNTNARARGANPRALDQSPRQLRTAATLKRGLDLLDGVGCVPRATVQRWEAEGVLRPLAAPLTVEQRIDGLYRLDELRGALDEAGEPP